MAKSIGEIVIQTRIDNRMFEEQVKDMQKQAEKAKSSLEELEDEKENVFDSSDEVDWKIEDYLEKVKEQLDESASGEFEKSFENMREQAYQLKEQLEPLMSEYNSLMAQYMQLTEKSKGTMLFESDKEEAEDLKKQIKEVVKEIEKLTGEKISVVGIDEIKEKVDEVEKKTKNIGNSLGGITKKITRWGLALVGISGAYSLIHGAMTTITKENEQLGANIEYIKWAITQTIKPIIEYIMNIAIKAVQVIGALIKMLTGVNIFQNANADKFAESMKSADKNSKGVANNLKDANKQLASFDEMNVLSDTSSSGGGGTGGVDTIMPDFDLSNLTSVEEEVQKFIDRWYEFGDEMETSLYDMPFSVWTEAFGKWDLAIYGVVQTFNGLWKIITGFFEFFKGIIDIIFGLIEGDNEKLKKGFDELIGGLVKIVTGFWEFIQGLTNTIKGLIKGVVLAIWEIIGNLISGAIDKFNNFKDRVVDVWNGIRENIKGVIQSIKNYLSEKLGEIGSRLGDIIGGAIKGVVNSILSILEGKINSFFKMINSGIGIINKIPGVSISKLQMVSFPRLAKGGIVNMPGSGVMVGSAIAGERGAEGVIPLTDSQQMELLGEAIGRYITINATVINSMNGRELNRELQKIQNENNFASNR